MTTVIFRTDASIAIGSGHVMRCLALAHVLRNSAEAKCIFICREHPGNLIDEIRKQGFTAIELPAACAVPPQMTARLSHAAWLGTSMEEDAKQTISAIGDSAPNWLVVDHYALDQQWEKYLRPHSKHLMAIDDLADRLHDCDLLLDPNPGQSEAAYSDKVPAACTILAGPRFAILRDEFRIQHRASHLLNSKNSLRRVLIAMGGVDKDNVTERLLRALQASALHASQFASIELMVVLGDKNPWQETVRETASHMRWPTEVIVGARNIAELMVHSDIAISAGGTMALERCCTGLAGIIITIADNQRSSAYSLQRHGCATILDSVNITPENLYATLIDFADPKQLQTARQACTQLVDGLGAHRIVEFMGLTRSTGTVRPLEKEDLKLVRAWRNHPAVRQQMSTAHEISESEHETWFEQLRSSSENREALIFERSGAPRGFVQFKEIGEHAAEWGFYVDPDAAQGTGSGLGNAALAYAFRQMRLETVHGWIKPDNDASCRFHRRMGFSELGQAPEQDMQHAGMIHFRIDVDQWNARETNYA